MIKAGLNLILPVETPVILSKKNLKSSFRICYGHNDYSWNIKSSNHQKFPVHSQSPVPNHRVEAWNFDAETYEY